MTDYTITPIRASFVQRARSEGIDDLGQAVERLAAEGGEPCRDALRRARKGERLILASYCPFTQAGPFREYGPVYILADPQAEPTGAPELPLGGATPYIGSAFVLRAYSAAERIVDAVITEPGAAPQQLARLLEREDTSFVLARFGAYGCYACRIDAKAGNSR
jgi:hypothetical protein